MIFEKKNLFWIREADQSEVTDDRIILPVYFLVTEQFSSVLFSNLPDDPAWIACRDTPVRDVPCHHAASTDHHVIPYVYTGAYLSSAVSPLALMMTPLPLKLGPPRSLSSPSKTGE